MSIFLPWGLVALLAVHAAWDAVAMAVLLFWPSLRVVSDVYPSLFTLPHIQEDMLVQRLLLYWMASGSLCRVAVCVFPLQPGVWFGATLVYWMEGLALEYEAFSAGSMGKTKARHMSLFSLAMGVACLCACLQLSVFGAPECVQLTLTTNHSLSALLL